MKSIVLAAESAVTINAAAAPAEGEQPKQPTFDVLAYTGGALRVGGWGDPVVIDLKGLKAANSVKANLDHDSTKRVGHVDKIENSKQDLRLAGTVSAANVHASEVVESSKSGYPWQASVEVQPERVEQVAAGVSVNVNGQELAGPLSVVRKGKLLGFAFVSHGADDNTIARIAASAAKKEGDMKPELVEFVRGLGVDPDTVEASAIPRWESLLAAENATRKKPDVASKTLDDILAAQRAERDRVTAINDMTARIIAERPQDLEAVEALARHAIEAKMDVREYELQLLRATRDQAGAFRPRVGNRGAQVTNELLEAAICLAGNLEKPETRFKPELLEAAHKMYPRGISLGQVLLTCARANGYDTTHTNRVDLGVLQAAFDKGRPVHAQGWSTLSIPGILSNTANKFLVEGWNAVDSTWRAISAIRSVNDFKTQTSYALTGGFDYAQVGPGGELPHATVGEETYTNKAETFGKMFAITRTDLINDDLGALTRVPQKLGRGAATKLNKVFWTEFLDNSTFFASGNNNVSTGGGSALSLAGLTAAEVVFMNQTDPDGEPLGMMPAVLLVPPTLKTTALQLMQSTSLIGTPASNALAGNTNVFAGRYVVASAPYMENSSYTGYSTAAWYLLCNPADLATIEVCFLNGQQTPVVETADADFNVLGIQMRGYHDFGVALQEPRAGVRSAGS